MEAAAEILRQARAPLVCGLSATSCEAQRQAVALAEAIGAVLDPAGAGEATSAYQAIGSSTATFGEIRDRAELVVVWRADPAVTHPRLLGRLRLDRAARGSRTLVVVDSQLTATAEEADVFLALDAAHDFEALWALRALVSGAPLDRDRLPLDGLDDLAQRLLGADNAAVIYGAVDELGALALFSLVRDLSRERHVVTQGLRRDGNARGAEDVLAWQTGFPAAVSFARGYPRANAGEFSAAALLERGEVDAALVVGPLEHLPPAAADRLRELPTVVVDARATSQAARVAFIPAADGIEVPGTVHRMDGVPIPLRAPLAAERPSGRGRAGRDRRAPVMLRIADGRVYDPANGIAGEVRDVCVQDGKIVADVPGHARRIDARGMVVMPGGVDIHAHIAGPKVNAARKLAPEEHRADVLERTAIARSGTGGTVPSTFATGYRYALLGYTTVVEAATPPLAARHTLAEIRDTPVIDAAFLILMGNNLPLFELIRSEPARAREAIAWYLQATGGYGVKLVNPGGVEMFKRGNGNVTSLDDEGPGVTPRSVIETVATAVHELGLPHPVHVHCNNLGVAGNFRTTLDTLRTLDGRRAHLAHLQFHAYGGRAGGRPRSRAPELAEYLGSAPGAERRRRAGDVRPGDDDDRRRAGLRGPARGHARPLGQRRHRGRDRLRDRPVHLPRAQLRACAAVGDRPRAVPAQPRPVADRALHRPPQRRLVPELSAADPPADGSRVPQRADPPGQQARR